MYEDSKYKILQLHGMPPSVFGETYVVAVGIHTMGSYYKGEYHILTQRQEPQLKSNKWGYEQASIPTEFLTVNVEFMIEESITSAKNNLYDRLAERAVELSANHLLTEQVILEECIARPFVGCWMRNVFNQQLVDLAKTTESKSLHQYIHTLSQLPRILQG